MKTSIQYRDVTLLSISDENYLAIACDSSASIGMKSGDILTIDPKISARFCVRVALIELLALGVTPIMLTNVLGNEYETTGKQMLEGIFEELSLAGFSNLPINGSTEENMQTTMTSIGITIIGIIEKKHCSFGNLKADMVVLMLGTPLVGKAVIDHMESIFSYHDLQCLQNAAGVTELLPVGSQGVIIEANKLAESSQLKFIPDSGLDLNQLTQSAGPSTVLLIAADPQRSEILQANFHLVKIGVLAK